MEYDSLEDSLISANWFCECGNGNGSANDVFELCIMQLLEWVICVSIDSEGFDILSCSDASLFLICDLPILVSGDWL